MIDDLDEVLKKLLERELPIKNGEVDIQFDHPKREWSARLSRPTINIFLYDIRENQKLRQTMPMWETERQADGTASQRRRPVRVDLYYMITAWATAPEDEHRLISRTLMALFRFATIPEELLPATMPPQAKQIPIMVAQYNELQNATDIWNVLDNEMRPVLSLITTVSFDPYTEWAVPLVRSREITVGPSSLPISRRLDSRADVQPLWTIGGQLRSAKPLDSSQVRLTLVDYGEVVPLQPDGRFTIGRLRPGGYTLEVVAGSGPARRYSISVPAPDYVLDI